jgi:hypothetical protein
MSAEKLDAMVLAAIKSFHADRPAKLGCLRSMVLLRRAFQGHGDTRACSGRGDMGYALQRLKQAGKIAYSRKPAGWVAT